MRSLADGASKYRVLVHAIEGSSFTIAISLSGRLVTVCPILRPKLSNRDCTRLSHFEIHGWRRSPFVQFRFEQVTWTLLSAIDLFEASWIEVGRGETYSWRRLKCNCFEIVTLITDCTGGRNYFSHFLFSYFLPTAFCLFRINDVHSTCFACKRLPCVGTSSAYVDLD